MFPKPPRDPLSLTTKPAYTQTSLPSPDPGRES